LLHPYPSVFAAVSVVVAVIVAVAVAAVATVVSVVVAAVVSVRLPYSFAVAWSPNQSEVWVFMKA